jgi:serine/threonine protein kinase
MELLGDSVSRETNKNPKRFTPAHCLKITIKLLDLIQKLHDLGYVNGDVKLENILYGRAKTSKEDDVFLIDFGLSTKYLNNDG